MEITIIEPTYTPLMVRILPTIVLALIVLVIVVAIIFIRKAIKRRRAKD